MYTAFRIRNFACACEATSERKWSRVLACGMSLTGRFGVPFFFRYAYPRFHSHSPDRVIGLSTNESTFGLIPPERIFHPFWENAHLYDLGFAHVNRVRIQHLPQWDVKDAEAIEYIYELHNTSEWIDSCLTLLCIVTIPTPLPPPLMSTGKYCTNGEVCL